MFLTMYERLNFIDSISNLKTNKSQGDVLAENSKEQQVFRDLGEMDAILFPLMEKQGKICFPDYFCDFTHSTKIPGGKGGQ